MIKFFTIVTFFATLSIWQKPAQASQCSDFFNLKYTSSTFVETWEGIFESLQDKQVAQKKNNPNQPYSFVAPEYASLIVKMKYHLKEWSKIAPQDTTAFIIEPLLKELASTLSTGPRYDEVIKIAKRFALAMSVKLQGVESIHFGDSVKATPNTFWSLVKESHFDKPLFGEFVFKNTEDPPIVLLTFDKLTIKDFLRIWAKNTIVIGLMTELELFDNRRVGALPVDFFDHDVGHGFFRSLNQKLVDRFYPGFTLKDWFSLRSKTADKLIQNISMLKNEMEREGLFIMLFEIMHERDIHSVPKMLKAFMRAQMENPREGKSWYSAEFVGESTEPKNVFIDLIVKDRVESSFYGKEYKLTLGTRDFGFWRDRLNQLYALIMDLN